MIANILQLSAGILLGISSFIETGKFQVPIIGKKLPGSLEKFKQTWMIRIGLMLLVLGYALPIMNWDPIIFGNLSETTRIILAFVFTGILVVLGYGISACLARRDFDKEPQVGDKDHEAPDGTVAFKILEETESEKEK